MTGEWQFATGADCSTLEEVQALLDESVKKSCEGLMVKTLHGPSAKYDIARRSHNWLKVLWRSRASSVAATLAA